MRSGLMLIDIAVKRNKLAAYAIFCWSYVIQYRSTVKLLFDFFSLNRKCDGHYMSFSQFSLCIFSLSSVFLCLCVLLCHCFYLLFYGPCCLH